MGSWRKKALLGFLVAFLGACVVGSGEPLLTETVFQVIQIPTLGSDDCGEVHWQWGSALNTKAELRDFTRPVYLQVHQTDYWPGENGASIKTNLYVSTKRVYQIHAPEVVIRGNYDDLYHVEVAWVSPSRTMVVDHGITFHREAGVWTPEREALLETALCYGVEQLRALGVEPVIVTHRQTYWARELDPDRDIAQATYRIAKKRGYRLDFEWTRHGGQSAALWYPLERMLDGRPAREMGRLWSVLCSALFRRGEGVVSFFRCGWLWACELAVPRTPVAARYKASVNF